ncbi:449_t:CDS:2 [Funneliformis mosseae]|uniref:449_t:CDS:1 n=1 Tax=Funneliformis mosseae TaxID=27381 RepID=A0A9N8Z7N8_FUNMO|nr:449_t:CDS:2 [Funneliformis mosseae]
MDIANLLLTESDEQTATLPSSSWNFETPNNSPPNDPTTTNSPALKIPRLSPDIIYQILQNFKFSRSSLNKFLRIDQTWCHISLSFLWQCPFNMSLKVKSSILLIRTLLSFLSEQEKSELTRNNIELSDYESDFSKSKIYNYPDYIRTFDLKHFRLSMLHWLCYLQNHRSDDISLIMELNKIYNDIPTNYSSVNLASEIIYGMLFRRSNDHKLQHLIIENDPYQDIITSNHLIHKSIININGGVEDNALSRLEKFEFHYKIERRLDEDLLINRIVRMFEKMKEYVKSLKWLEVNIKYEGGRIPKIGKALMEFIEGQRKMEVLGIHEFWMREESEMIYERICKSQQNSLKHIRFCESCNFKELIKGLNECNNLVTLEILRLFKYDYSSVSVPDKEFEGKTLSIRNFYTWDINDAPDISNYFIQIFKMSNKNLKTLTLTYITSDIIITLVNFCPNVTHLSLSFFQHLDSIPDLLSLLLPVLPLEQFFLKIDNMNSDSDIFTQDYWNRISISIPDSVIHLGIDFKIESNMFNKFLKECKAQLRTISLFQGYMLNRHYLQLIVQYTKNCNQLLNELRFSWNPDEIGFISNSNLGDAKEFIKIIDKVESFNKPFYDIKLSVPNVKDQVLTPSLSYKVGSIKT